MYQNGGRGCGGPVPQIMRKNDGKLRTQGKMEITN